MSRALVEKHAENQARLVAAFSDGRIWRIEKAAHRAPAKPDAPECAARHDHDRSVRSAARPANDI
ncbi:MAG: hypothetical protein AAFR90_13420 [Pseudomonadota bacterium]